MIKFKAGSDGKKTVYGFGLSEENIKLLKKGYPIYIDNPDFADFNVIIMYGETEQEITNLLKETGLLDKRLTIKEIPEEMKNKLN